MWDVATGVHAICKGNVVPMDIMSVVQGSNRFFSFMGLSYGAGSTIDIGTENLRCALPLKGQALIVRCGSMPGFPVYRSEGPNLLATIVSRLR